MSYMIRGFSGGSEFVMETGLKFFQAIDHARIYKKHPPSATFTVFDEENNDIVYDTRDEEN